MGEDSKSVGKLIKKIYHILIYIVLMNVRVVGSGLQGLRNV